MVPHQWVCLSSALHKSYFVPCIWLLKSLIGCFPKASPLCLFYQNLTSWVSDMMLILRVWWILPLDNFFSARVSILIGKASWFWCLSNISYGFSALIIVFPLGPKLSLLLFALLGLLSSIILSECQKFQFILKWRLLCQTDIPNTQISLLFWLKIKDVWYFSQSFLKA